MKDLSEANSKLSDINNKIVILREEIEREFCVSNRSQDARMVGLDNIQKVLVSSGMWINAYYSLARLHTNDRILNKTEFLKSFGSIQTIKDNELLLMNQLRNSLITSIHFEIDNMISNILKHLGFEPKKKFGVNVKTALEKAISDEEFEHCHHIMMIYAQIRNSFHNNGIHRGKDLEFCIGGLIYTFKEGQPITFASWETVLTIIDESIGVISKIIMSEKIAWPDGEMKDDFASFDFSSLN